MSFWKRSSKERDFKEDQSSSTSRKSPPSKTTSYDNPSSTTVAFPQRLSGRPRASHPQTDRQNLYYDQQRLDSINQTPHSSNQSPHSIRRISPVPLLNDHQRQSYGQPSFSSLLCYTSSSTSTPPPSRKSGSLPEGLHLIGDTAAAVGCPTASYVRSTRLMSSSSSSIASAIGGRCPTKNRVGKTTADSASLDNLLEQLCYVSASTACRNDISTSPVPCVLASTDLSHTPPATTTESITGDDVSVEPPTKNDSTKISEFLSPGGFHVASAATSTSSSSSARTVYRSLSTSMLNKDSQTNEIQTAASHSTTSTMTSTLQSDFAKTFVAQSSLTLTKPRILSETRSSENLCSKIDATDLPSERKRGERGKSLSPSGSYHDNNNLLSSPTYPSFRSNSNSNIDARGSSSYNNRLTPHFPRWMSRKSSGNELTNRRLFLGGLYDNFEPLPGKHNVSTMQTSIHDCCSAGSSIGSSVDSGQSTGEITLDDDREERGASSTSGIVSTEDSAIDCNLSSRSSSKKYRHRDTKRRSFSDRFTLGQSNAAEIDNSDQKGRSRDDSASYSISSGIVFSSSSASLMLLPRANSDGDSSRSDHSNAPSTTSTDAFVSPCTSPQPAGLFTSSPTRQTEMSGESLVDPDRHVSTYYANVGSAVSPSHIKPLTLSFSFPRDAFTSSSSTFSSVGNNSSTNNLVPSLVISDHSDGVSGSGVPTHHNTSSTFTAPKLNFASDQSLPIYEESDQEMPSPSLSDDHRSGSPLSHKPPFLPLSLDMSTCDNALHRRIPSNRRLSDESSSPSSQLSSIDHTPTSPMSDTLACTLNTINAALVLSSDVSSGAEDSSGRGMEGDSCEVDNILSTSNIRAGRKASSPRLLSSNSRKELLVTGSKERRRSQSPIADAMRAVMKLGEDWSGSLGSLGSGGSGSDKDCTSGVRSSRRPSDESPKTVKENTRVPDNGGAIGRGSPDAHASPSSSCSSPNNNEEKPKKSCWHKLRKVMVWTPFVQSFKKRQYLWIQLAGHEGNFKAGEGGTILKKYNENEATALQALMVSFGGGRH